MPVLLRKIGVLTRENMVLPGRFLALAGFFG